MIDHEQFGRLKVLQAQGLNGVQIAGALDITEKTARKYMAIDCLPVRKVALRASKLDAFKPRITAMLEAHEYSAAQVFTQLQREGYQGGYTTVKDYVRAARPPRRPAFLTLAFAPGECAQVDWGSAGALTIGQTRRRLSFFVMVLCYSRMLYVRFTLRETMEHWLQCHRDAFEFFGGVPSRLMVDNCKTAVLHNRRFEKPVFNPAYVQFADHYNFDISACNVRAGHEKGRVENAVGYVKKSMLRGLAMENLAAIQAAADEWRDSVANVRIHGTTHKQPLELFEQESHALVPLPSSPYECVRTEKARANSQFRISFDGNKYSVPAEHASRRDLQLRAGRDIIRIFGDGVMIAEHVRRYTRGCDYEHPDHPKALLEHRRKGRDQAVMRRFLAIGPEAEVYYYGLTERRLNSMHHVRQIVAMLEGHDAALVRRVMADAATFNAYSADCVINLLEQHKRRADAPPSSPLHLTRNQDLLEIEQPVPNLNIYDKTNAATNEED
jgi:transposase